MWSKAIICWLCGLAGLFGVVSAGWGETMQAKYQLGASTRVIEQGAVLENDLVYHAGDSQFGVGSYPQAAVVQWEPISGSQPGRYHVSLRARTTAWGGSSLVLQAWVPETAGGQVLSTANGPMPVTLATLPLNGFAFAKPGEWQQFTLDFDVEQGKPVNVGLMYVGKENCAAGKVQVEAASLTLQKLPLPVCVSWARPVKLRYRLHEQGAMEIRLTNATAQPQTVAVRPLIESEAGARTTGKEKTFQLPAQATVSGTLPFTLPAEEGGYAATCELLQHTACIDQRGDVFAVSDSPFTFLITGEGPMHLPTLIASAFPLGLQGFNDTVMQHWEQYSRDCALSVESMRRIYTTYFEYFAWAREDAVQMTEDSDEPYLAGQCSWPVSRKQLRLLNGLMKNHGIAPVAYVNGDPFGWLGFDLLRRRPEWFSYNKATGQPDAQFDTAYQDKYFKHEQQATYYPALRVNYTGVSPIDKQTYLDFHLKQLKASAEMYGWEAFRYDAGPLPSEVFPKVKDYLAHLNPPVAIGNNLGICCLGSEPSEKWKTYCRQGSLMMEENITNAFSYPTDPHRRWVDWIDYLHQGYNLTRSSGGHYVYINGPGNWLSVALGYAIGGHSYGIYVAQKSPFGDYERFMIHYGAYFWDLRKQLLPAPAEILAVHCQRALWWKQFASQRTLAANHRQIIVPLLNPPTEQEVTGTTPVEPINDATVTFTPKHGEKVTAWLLAPEPVARRVPLTIRQHGAQVEVSVPRFWGWTNVVFDCRQ